MPQNSVIPVVGELFAVFQLMNIDGQGNAPKLSFTLKMRLMYMPVLTIDQVQLGADICAPHAPQFPST